MYICGLYVYILNIVFKYFVYVFYCVCDILICRLFFVAVMGCIFVLYLFTGCNPFILSNGLQMGLFMCLWVVGCYIQRVMSAVCQISVQYRYLQPLRVHIAPVSTPILKRRNLGCLKILCIYFLL